MYIRQEFQTKTSAPKLNQDNVLIIALSNLHMLISICFPPSGYMYSKQVYQATWLLIYIDLYIHAELS